MALKVGKGQNRAAAFPASRARIFVHTVGLEVNFKREGVLKSLDDFRLVLQRPAD